MLFGIRVTAPLQSVQIAQQIGAIWKKRADHRVIGFHSPAPWLGASTLTVDGVEVEIADCRSELEIRERLCARGDDAPPLVILTGIAETDLAADVLARLARRKLHRVERWDILREMFGARELDARLGRVPWLVDAVVALAGDGGMPPVPGGFLSEDEVWATLFDRALGIPSGRPDLVTLLEWSLGKDVGRISDLGDQAKNGIQSRLESTAGKAGELVFVAAAAGHGADAVALGLVFDVLIDPRGAGDVEISSGRGRFEQRFFAGMRVGDESARAWGHAAREIARRQRAGSKASAIAAQLQRAESLLKECKVEAHAWLSAILPAGIDGRLSRLGAAVEGYLADSSALDPVANAARLARSHHLLSEDRDRVQAIEMVERLCRYLSTPPVEKRSFAEAALAYAREGALVDRALNTLIGGDPQPAFSRATEKLRARVVERCENDARAFAELLRGWTEADGSRDGVVPIEDVLERLLAPIAAKNPVLLVVLDGMSGAVFEEIASDMTMPERGWLAMRPAAAGVDAPLVPSAPPVIAALPTLTNVSRASLFCGTVTDGGQAREKKGFADNPALLRVSGQKFPPRLFHKGELTGVRETDLSGEVRDAIAGGDHRIVGVVLNAVDDFLAKSDQLRHGWRCDTIQLLAPLLETANDAGRVVVLTSDHGHVLDTGSERAVKADSDRFRLDDGAVGEGEIALVGRRLAPSVGARIVAAWSRHLRYASKKNGYHGGVSPQEAVVPLGVFAPLGLQVEGWQETVLHRPDWWLGDAVEPSIETKIVSLKPRPRMPTPPPRQHVLFPPVEEAAEEATNIYAEPEWIALLFEADVFRQQIAAAGRVAPSQEQIRQVLTSLSQRGGKLTRRALAQRLGLPASRVQGIVTGLRRVLNVDGYDVLEIDEASDSLSINVEVLRVQFGIGD